VAPYTNFGGKVLLGPTFVDISDDVVEFDVSAETNIPGIEVYGPSQVRSIAGTTKWTGNIKVVYDYLGGVAKGYRVLMTECGTPTTGGLYCQYKPTGEGAGEEQQTMYIIVGYPKMDDRGGSDIQTRTFPFTVNGQVTSAAQTT